MILEKLPNVQALSLAEKEKLAEEIWEDISRTRDSLPIPPEHLELLEERKKAFDQDPTQGRS
ncbi:MAG: addiction module protein [Puniceicoccales bacterium]